MAVYAGETVLLTVLTHRHPRRADKYLNVWFVILDLSADETLDTACGYEFVGAHAVSCVSRHLADCLRPFLVRCYVCATIKAARYFCPRWGHYVKTVFVRRCPTCAATGEVCFGMHHPNCYQCDLDWHLIGDSDSSDGQVFFESDVTDDDRS